MDFRVRAIVCAACAALAAGCRASGAGEGLHAAVQVGELGAAASEAEQLVAGHRFGGWLALAPDPPAIEVLWYTRELERAGALEQAIESLGDAIEDGSACASLLEARGALYVTTGFPRAAAGDFQRAVGMAPERASGWYGLGHAYEVLGLSRQALEALERARGLGMEDAEVELSLARVQRALGRCGTAARHYELALARLAPVPTALCAEAVTLASEDPSRAQAVAAQRERLEACGGVALSDDGWLLRELVDQLRGAHADEVAATLHALDAPPEELDRLVVSLLQACQLADPETAEATRERLLAAESDPERRDVLARSLARK